MNARWLLLCTIALWLSACGGGKNTALEPAPLPTVENQVQVTLLWHGDSGSDSGDGLRIGLALSEDTLYTVAVNGKVKAWNVHDGRVLWEQKTQYAFSCGAGVAENTDFLLIGTRDGLVVALRKADGSFVWERRLGSEILSSPEVGADFSIVRSADGKLFGLETANGAPLWTYSRQVPGLSLHGTSSPLRLSDIVLAGFDNGKLVGLEAKTGKALWEVAVAQPSGRSDLERMVDIDADLQISGPTLYVSAYQGRTVAVDLRNGQLSWEKNTSTHSGFILDETMLYQSEANGDMIALSRRSGTGLWKQEQLKNRQLSAPAEIGRYLAVGDMEGYVHIVRKKDGQIMTRHRVGNDPIVARPLVKDNLLLVLNQGGTLHALTLTTNEQ